MNSENSKTSKSHILVLKLTNELDLRIGEKIIALSKLVFIHMEKQKAHTIIILKYLHQHGMMNLNYQMDRILGQIFKIISNTCKKNTRKILINHQYKYM